MIDRIDNSNYYNNYTTMNKKKVNTKDFSLELKERPFSQPEDSASKEESGVQLELNQNEYAKEKDSDSKVKSINSTQSSFASNGITFPQIKQAFHSFVQLLKETWNLIWNDPPAKSDQNHPLQSSSSLNMESESLDVLNSNDLISVNNSYTSSGENKDDSQIQKVLKSKDLNQLTKIITQNGKLKLAKNSQLLTTYDRQGKIVQLDGSEKERILRGDKNLMKS